MTFGVEGQVKREQAREQIKAFVAAGHTLIDTARIYQCATPEGDTETILGQILAEEPEIKAKVSVHTKANPSMAPWMSLSKESVIAQCEESLAKLGLKTIDLFYFHTPDIKTDIDESLDGIQQLHKEGKIKEFGLSNFPAWKVVDIWHRCKARGIVLPTVYQGMYNIITRDMEREIVPVVRELGMRLYMYNPLAGGLLTGRYKTFEDMAAATSGRFSPEFDAAFGGKVKAGKMYQARYGKDEFFRSLQLLQSACDNAKIPMNVAALRWLRHHSYLSGPDGDGVIFGVSNITHMSSNLKAWSPEDGDPLPEGVVSAAKAAWVCAQPACESYFRGYGPTPGSIDGYLAMRAEKRQKLSHL